MDTPSSAREAGPISSPLGPKVGAWRLFDVRGQGTYGTVYRARPEGQPLAEPVALKLSIYPGDARFEREVELLSRIRHPSVPRLLEALDAAPTAVPVPLRLHAFLLAAPRRASSLLGLV